MKESTKLILMGLGAGVAANMLLAPSVASATASMPMVAAGGEGIVALGSAYYAYKHQSGKGGKIAAVAAGVAAGLLVSSVQSGALSKPAAPGSTPQATNVVKPSVKPGSALPTISAPAALPAPSTVISSQPGFTVVGGDVPSGAVSTAPTRPPTQAEIDAYNAYQAQQQAQVAANVAANLQRQQAEIAAQNSATGGAAQYETTDQGGAAARLGMGTRPKRRPGLGGRF